MRKFETQSWFRYQQNNVLQLLLMKHETMFGSAGASAPSETTAKLHIGTSLLPIIRQNKRAHDRPSVLLEEEEEEGAPRTSKTDGKKTFFVEYCRRGRSKIRKIFPPMGFFLKKFIKRFDFNLTWSLSSLLYETKQRQRLVICNKFDYAISVMEKEVKVNTP